MLNIDSIFVNKIKNKFCVCIIEILNFISEFSSFFTLVISEDKNKNYPNDNYLLNKTVILDNEDEKTKKTILNADFFFKKIKKAFPPIKISFEFKL